MINILIFVVSIAILAGFATGFYRFGKEALTAWIVVVGLLANLFVLKQIELLGFNATASDIFAIGSLLGLNLLQEKYGKKAAQRAIWTSFGGLLFFVFMAQMHLLYVPSEFDTSADAYRTLLMASPRLMMASLATFLIVNHIDSHLYAHCRRKWPNASVALISGFSMCCSQFIDTVLFSFLGLYGLVNAMIEIMVISYSIKLLAIITILPCSFMTQRIFKGYYAK